jgi:hypothetical protein
MLNGFAVALPSIICVVFVFFQSVVSVLSVCNFRYYLCHFLAFLSPNPNPIIRVPRPYLRISKREIYGRNPNNFIPVIRTDGPVAITAPRKSDIVSQ